MKKQAKVKQNIKPKKVVRSKIQPVPHKKVKRRKIRYGRILFALVCIALILYILSFLLDAPIRNILVSGNTHITDQEVIELAGIQNYPSYYKTFTFEMKKKLEQDFRIKKATVKKKQKTVFITIVENTPLFYNQTTGKTILLDLRETETINDAPVLLNYVPDTIYETFQKKMQLVNAEILDRISEIMYQPNNVDAERFLFIMADGNYVYVTLETLERINNYISIYAEFVNKYGNKKGILNLDSGQYFTMLE